MSWKYYLAGALLIALTLLLTALAYPQLPAVVTTHWNMNNQPNGYSPKWALFLVGPGLMLGLLLVWRALPWLSPRNFEVDTFRKTYLQIMLIILAVIAYMQCVMLWADLGHAMDIGRAIAGGVCLLFALLGNLLGKVRRNFYMGIRTPWALANERVWNATHRFAAKTFVVAGLAGLLMTVAGSNGWPVLVVLLLGALVPVIYSLTYYKQLERRGEL
jgi:uncharacterized membrane protein